MRPISNEKRALLIEAKLRGETERSIAKWLKISESSVTIIWKLFRETDSYEPTPYPGRQPILSEEKFEEIKIFVTNNPDKTLEEIIAELSLPIQKSRLSVLLIKAGYSFKKKTTYPAEQDREDVQKEREKFAETIKQIDVFKLVALDESSINLAYTRLYGRALKNKRVKEGVKDIRFERQSILSTFRLNGEMCPLIFSGTLNKELFSEYIKTQLKPHLAKDDILLMDNSSVHTSKLVLKTLKECGIKCLFLPKYSPDYNPIELLWSYMKSSLRKLKARTHSKLNEAIKFTFDELPLSHIAHWFAHCGYTVYL
jgi:transposase